ncbi:recombinase family protein [Actinacidiphila rubida]|uniref:Site-specific DNA recombinase n=1 Tax=Actinacidiphila rubida TaxID=310780 RepID=A0A1H8HZB5_9ACTN|nr:recombinase family protein [Actinacidiphila rubida]SEN61245.1 Site-specific DNA recombinase [Actinacidiphila rubida]
MLNVGGYARISDIGHLGDGRDGREGVSRQREDIDDLARSRRVRVHRVYEDNDRSAYQRRTRRTAFEEMVSDLESGVISGILAYAIDRIARQPRDLERLIDIYEQARRPMVFATTAGDYDLTTVDGRFQARIHVTIANKFSADAGRRVARQRQAEAAAGKPHQGKRAFGWKDAQHVDEREAEILRRARRDIVDGKLIATVHREWVEAQVRTPQTPAGRTISYSSVPYVLRNPRLCGFRSYIPQEHRARAGRLDPVEYLVERTDGSPVVGTWETIFTPAEWRELVDVLDARRQTGKGRKAGTPVTKRLLSGIARCGNCGSGLHSAMYQRGTPSYERYGYYYVCTFSGGGCGRLSRSGPPVEDHVERALLNNLGEKARGEARSEPEDPASADVGSALIRIDADKAEARRLRAEDLLSLAEFAREMRRLEEKERGLSQRASVPRVAPVHSRSLAARIVREWETYTVDMKRTVLTRSIEAVVVSRAGKGGAQRGVFRPELLEIVWK